MPEIRPFRGLRFDAGKAGPLDHAVTPPYDVISPEQREQLAAHPYNMVHLILPRAQDGGSPYDDAARRLDTWIGEGMLAQDAEPSLYLLRQDFKSPEGAPLVRRGFFAVARIPEAGEKTVLGHERTFDKPVEDRLALTRATQTNLGPVFALYSDPEGVLAPFLAKMELRVPDLEATTYEGTTHRLWRVSPDYSVTAFLEDKTLYIADGHHRFRTAQTYRDEMRAEHRSNGTEPWNYVLMGFVSMDDPGLKVLPTHRVLVSLGALKQEDLLNALGGWFDVEPVGDDVYQRVVDDRGACVLGLVLRGRGAFLLRFKDMDRTLFLSDDHGPAWCDLDVAVLHRGIFERVMGLTPEIRHGYETDAAAAVAAVDRGVAEAAFLLRATRADQIRACAEAGEPMPQKSTYFFPKLPTGAVMYRLV